MNDSDKLKADFVLVGAGGHSLVVRDVVESLGGGIRGYTALERSRHFDDIPWIGGDADLSTEALDTHLALAVGAVPLRRSLVNGLPVLDRAWPALVHPMAYVAESVEVGAGVQIMAGAVVQPAVILGDHCIVNTGAVIEHGSALGAFTHVAGGAVLGGDVSVGDGVLVGLGAVVLPERTIGAHATIGAGAVVSRDVGHGEVVVGIPARPR